MSILSKKREKSRQRYPKDLKRKIAKSYLSGEASYAVLAEENGLKGKDVVKEFVKWYRRELEKLPNLELMEEEKEDKKELSASELSAELDELKKQLRHEKLKNEMLETIIDLASSELNIDIRKKSVTKQSKK